MVQSPSLRTRRAPFGPSLAVPPCDGQHQLQKVWERVQASTVERKELRVPQATPPWGLQPAGMLGVGKHRRSRRPYNKKSLHKSVKDLPSSLPETCTGDVTAHEPMELPPSSS